MNEQLKEYTEPDWYHVVIPNYFDLDDFEYNPSRDSRRKDPYFLYLGRVTACKGVHIALQVCEKLGVHLVVSGPLFDDYKGFEWPSNVEYVGPSDAEKRKELMKNAVASFMPTVYSEPFGGVQVENFLCGTPVISTDWGAFPEVNIHGVTGYRCRTFDDFLNAAMDCLDGKINPADCRKTGELYSLENIAPKYEKYFRDVLNVHTGNGWYELSESTKNRIESML
jgi:glycosyltransferase involved in cell wall biosynthesis